MLFVVWWDLGWRHCGHFADLNTLTISKAPPSIAAQSAKHLTAAHLSGSDRLLAGTPVWGKASSPLRSRMSVANC
ncbi:hypothetical protein CVT26_012537 [Gymnopilus dilepis]|uniref:Uncharacterized protein n=1 Tax=Gymnopilus dilepis TaxID=231916 RepID=A0A409WAP2_9AGAR|nr:hypothetical protein CVT26_012537 [Gymnopilus dilepis]